MGKSSRSSDSSLKSELKDRIRSIVGDEPVAAFARRVGVGESLMRKYLAGSSPSTENLAAIASAAGVTVDWLATGQGIKSAEELRRLTKDKCATTPDVAVATPEVAPEGSRFVSSAHSQGRPPDGLAVGIGPDMPLHPDEEGGKENPLTTRYVERWVKIIKMVEDLPDAEAMMLLEETFVRAQNAKQIDELKRTVAELRAAQQKTG